MTDVVEPASALATTPDAGTNSTSARTRQRRTRAVPAGREADAQPIETPADRADGAEGTDGDADLIPLTAPRDGLPPVITRDSELAAACAALRAGTGPVAIDAERASGHRYGQRAYLIQLRRAGAGSFLIDPVAQPDLSSVNEAVRGAQWVLHAASQDLSCLDEVGLRPSVGLFDTEVAARILGRPRVGLASLVADVLGYSLAKEHSAVDWSTRPLKQSWLVYAALDVELLLELADDLRAEVALAGKERAVAQECEHVIVQSQLDAVPKPDPWRRTSGLHKVRGRRGLEVVRALWDARDRLARLHDVHPTRILPDAALVAAALTLPATFDALEALPEFRTTGARRNIRTWWKTVAAALSQPENTLPPAAGPSDAPPPPRSWAQRDPAAWERLEAARHAVAEIAEREHIPLENLLKPDSLRRLCWTPPTPLTSSAIESHLALLGARQWQRDLVVPALAVAWKVGDVGH